MKVKDSNIFPLPGNPHMLHLATITSSFREFIILFYPKTQQVYIEEVVLNAVDFTNDVYANCKFVDDDLLAADLAAFAESKGLLDVKKRMTELYETGREGLILGNMNVKARR